MMMMMMVDMQGSHGATTVIVALVFLLIMEGVKDPGVSLSVGACKWLLHFYLFK